jgi:hypothetical protein
VIIHEDRRSGGWAVLVIGVAVVALLLAFLAVPPGVLS